MKGESWKQFAAYQNGQKIRLNNTMEYIEEAINEMEKILDVEGDSTKKESLEFVSNNLIIVKHKTEDAIEKNNLLKEIVKDDYQPSEITEWDA